MATAPTAVCKNEQWREQCVDSSRRVGAEPEGAPDSEFQIVVVLKTCKFQIPPIHPPLGDFQLVSEPGTSLEPNRSK
jgi:hypothetical protein